MIQENSGPEFHKWNFPSGGVEEGETIEGAAIREVKEETGLDVKLVDYLGIFQGGIKRGCKHVYIGEVIGGDLKLQPEEININPIKINPAFILWSVP